MHLHLQTEWEGIVVMRSKDHTKVVYGGTDDELIEKFRNSQPLIDGVEDKKRSQLKKVDMSKVIQKISKNSKRLESVPESPDVTPTKVPECVKDMLPKSSSLAKEQARTLGSIPLDHSDSQVDYLSPVGSFVRKKPNVSLFCAYKPARGNKKGKGCEKKA